MKTLTIRTIIITLCVILSLGLLMPLPAPAAEIHKAAKDGDLDTIKKLLKKDKKLLDSGNRLDQSALIIAAYQGHKEIVEFLLKKKTNVNKQDGFGATALHMAIANNQAEVAAILMSKGANINLRSVSGKIPMQIAVENENIPIVDLFAQGGVNLKAPIDQFNRTLLHRSAIMGKAKVVDYLIGKGLDINLKDKTERTAIDLAAAAGHVKVVALLKQKGAVIKPEEPLEISYVANCGFVLTSGIKKVMIDSLFNHGYGQFHILTKEIVQKMERAEEPFNGVKFVLITHNFPDHFNVALTERYMSTHKSAILISPRQVNVDMDIYGLKFSSLKHRMVSLTPPVNSGTIFSVKDLRMNAFRLNHESKTVQNLGYAFELGGKSIFLPGNAFLKQNTQIYKNFGFKRYNLDIVFVQYFDFKDAETRAIIKEHLNPKHIILMHVPITNYEEAKKEIEKHKDAFPSVTLFSKQLEKKVFK